MRFSLQPTSPYSFFVSIYANWVWHLAKTGGATKSGAGFALGSYKWFMHCKVEFAESDGGSKLIISSPEIRTASRMWTIKSRRAIKISPEVHQCNIAILRCALESLLLLHVQEVSNSQSQNQFDIDKFLRKTKRSKKTRALEHIILYFHMYSKYPKINYNNI